MSASSKPGSLVRQTGDAAGEPLREVGHGYFEFLDLYALLRADDADLLLHAVSDHLHGIEYGVVLLKHDVELAASGNGHILCLVTHVAELQHVVGRHVDQVVSVDVGGRTDTRTGFDADRDADERFVVRVFDDARDTRDLLGHSGARGRGPADDDLPSREFPRVAGSGEQLFQNR